MDNILKKLERNMKTTFLQIQNLNFKYNKSKVALKNVSFSIQKGSFHGLIGGNGAGKSTLIKILTKALENQSGKILVNNKNYLNLKNSNLVVSYFPDEIVFPTGLTVYEYLKNEYQVINNNDKFIKEKITKLLKEFEIGDCINKSPNRLSSGQKKKVELVRIMLESPQFIILDEPTNYLDPHGREILFECLKYFNRQGVTILISSHILQELKLYIDSATIIDNGQIKFSGSVHGDELIKKYNEINSGKLEVFKDDASK